MPSMPPSTTSPPPLVVAIEMGLGHLRPADSLARALGVPYHHVDRAPLAGPGEQKQWGRTRNLYEKISRLSQWPLAGAPLRALLSGITHIPHLHPRRDLSAPSLSLRYLEKQIAAGLGAGLCAELERSGAPLLTTFFAPALIADRLGLDNVYCLVTDADIARVWVRSDVAKSRVHYFAPSERARHRLLAYGVAPERVTLTGFPLPDELVGGPQLPVLRRNLARRLLRLDRGGAFRESHRDELGYFLGTFPEEPPRPPTLTFAVGGAGAQAELARQFLPSLRPEIEAGRLRLVLMAGVRRAVEQSFLALLKREGLDQHPDVLVVIEEDFDAYFRTCNAVLAETDILWTKPSEMTFYGALGLPLVLSWPVGAQEQYNRRWAVENGAGLRQRDPRYAGDWLAEWLADGTLAAAAWSGFMRLPKFGLYRILETFGIAAAQPAPARSHAAR